MLSQLDIIAFEQSRTMPYPHSPYPEPIDPQEKMVEEAKEQVAQLKAFIAEHDHA